MKRELRAVIDTNLFISGLFARDALSAQLQDLWINQQFELVTSVEIIKEVSRVLSYPVIPGSKSALSPEKKMCGGFSG